MKFQFQQHATRFKTVAICLVGIGLSAALAWSIFSGAAPHVHHHANHGSEQNAQEQGSPSVAASASAAIESATARTVVIDMNDKLRFAPAQWEATEGEALRLVVVNSGKARHELVIGQEKELADHAKQMRDAAQSHHHHLDNAVSVEPGQAAVLNWTFKSAGTWGMACFEPGHYEAGMAGQITVKAKHSH